MFDALPPELVLRILVFLDIQGIHDCQLVSTEWNVFIKQNESVIYREVAIQHNFVSNWPPSLDAEKAANPGSWMASTTSWKDLCPSTLISHNAYTNHMCTQVRDSLCSIAIGTLAGSMLYLGSACTNHLGASIASN